MGAPNSAPKAVPAAAISRGAKFRRTRDHAAFQHRTATLLPSPRALNTAPRRSRGTSGVRPRFGRRCPRSAQAQTALHPRSSSPALCQAGADLPGAPGGRLIAEESGAGPAASSPACSAPLALRRRAGWGKFGAAERASGTAALRSASPGRTGRRPGLAHSPTKDEKRKQQTIYQPRHRAVAGAFIPSRPRRILAAPLPRQRDGALGVPGRGAPPPRSASRPLRGRARSSPLLTAPHRGCPGGGLRQLSAERGQSSHGHIWARSAAAAQGSWEGAAADARSPITAWQLPLR